MDLISRKAVADILTDPAYPYEPGIERAIMKLPSVPAVPLDKLCEWLETNARLVRPDGSRWNLDWLKWKEELTKWMEEQDAVD